MKLKTDLDEYNIRWEGSDNPHRIDKRDRLWRILKYGDIHEFENEYYRVNLDDYHVILSLHGEMDIVSSYESNNIPDINYSDYTNSDHATNRMVKRGITTKPLRETMNNHIVYDRQPDNRWKIMSYLDGERFFVVVNSDNKTVVTMFLDN